MSISIGQVSQFINVITNPLFLNVVKQGAKAVGVDENKVDKFGSLLENLGKLSNVISQFTGSGSNSVSSTSQSSYSDADIEGMSSLLGNFVNLDSFNSIGGLSGLAALDEYAANFDPNAYYNSLNSTNKTVDSEQAKKESEAAFMYNMLQSASLGDIVDDILEHGDMLAALMDLGVIPPDDILVGFLEKLRQIISKLDEDVKKLNKEGDEKNIKTVFNRLLSADGSDVKGVLTLLA